MGESTPVRFVADAMLGRLARWLRALGYDTVYLRVGEDARLLDLARREGRILLTRDTGIPRRRPGLRLLFIESDRVQEQVRQVIRALDLPRPRGPAGRCLRCNGLLVEVPRAEVEGAVPPYVFATQEAFWRCPGCRQVYWAGTHVRLMAEALAAACA